MKIPILVAASMLTLTLGICAQQPKEPADLLILRASWTKARLQAVSPIDQKYLQALEALKLKYTRAGQLDEALTVDAEIKSLAAPQSSRSSPPAEEEKKLTRAILCGGAWTYHIPQEGNSWTYEFSQDRKVLVDKKEFGSWSLTTNTLRIENADGRLWMEYPLELKAGDKGRLYLEERDSSKGQRKSVTLTQQ